MPAPTTTILFMGKAPGSLGRLFAADLRLEHVLQPIFDLLVRLVHFLVGQGAVVGPVIESVSEAFRSGWNAVAAVDIEKAQAAEQVAARRADLRLNPVGSNGVVHDDSD